MKNQSKRNIIRWGKKNITAGNIKILTLFLALLALLIDRISQDQFSLIEFLDVGVLASFIVVFISELIAKVLSEFIGRKFEDAEKLISTPGELVKKYSREKAEMIPCGSDLFPEILLCLRKIDAPAFDIRINHDHKDQHYVLPNQIAAQSDWLMKAHSHSTVYNNMNVRIDDIRVKGNQVELLYSKTTYFDSLITNRAMDYPLPNNKTVREIFEPGPFLSPLSQSKLSNHLGFNGFVELSDGNIIFVKRSGKVSIGKRTLATSIGASFKVAYGLKDNGSLSVKRISNAIRMEIFDELKISIPEEEDLSKSIFAFYRDLVEGGKPQFLFYYRCLGYDKESFEHHFNEVMKEHNEKIENKKKLTIDGTHFEYFTRETLQAGTLSPDSLTITGERGEHTYHMVPSAAASVAMLLEALKN